MSREGALWIGGVSSFLSLLMLCHFSNVGHFLQLENYMDEGFLKSGLEQMGEMNVLSIKVMKNKITGEPASYGFVNFDNDHHALIAMHRLNGKVIPNSNPVSAKSWNQMLEKICHLVLLPL